MASLGRQEPWPFAKECLLGAALVQKPARYPLATAAANQVIPVAAIGHAIQTTPRSHSGACGLND